MVTTLNFSSQRNIGKLTANLQTVQLCYLQIPIRNVVIFRGIQTEASNLSRTAIPVIC
jgi:hypothetical protein